MMKKHFWWLIVVLLMVVPVSAQTFQDQYGMYGDELLLNPLRPTIPRQPRTYREYPLNRDRRLFRNQRNNMMQELPQQRGFRSLRNQQTGEIFAYCWQQPNGRVVCRER